VLAMCCRRPLEGKRQVVGGIKCQLHGISFLNDGCEHDDQKEPRQCQP
jgi:hypothetical protein